jgi:NAD(P)-dependent dehydrogenase (short-subunit alcohol dehydrogenase family)
MTTTRRTSIALAAGATLAAGEALAQTKKTTGTVLITGANRGIGFEMARSYASAGYKVIATARKPEEAEELQALAKANANIAIEKLDVTDTAAIDALAAKYKGVPIDILINNAGVLGDKKRQGFGTISYADFDAVMDTNVKGPLKISEAFIDNVAASNQKRLVAISSTEGSLTESTTPRLVIYRASKSALNMAMRNVALSVKDKGVIVSMINPGAVETDMTRGAAVKLTPVDEAARDVIKVIGTTTLAKTGAFLSFDGREIPW